MDHERITEESRTPHEHAGYEPPTLVVIGPIEAVTLSTSGKNLDSTKPKP
jgi:hypothetical protein